MSLCSKDFRKYGKYSLCYGGSTQPSRLSVVAFKVAQFAPSNSSPLVWAYPHAIHYCRGHLLKWWVANSRSELWHMGGCYTPLDKPPYPFQPPTATLDTSSPLPPRPGPACTPSLHPVMASSLIDGAAPLRVNLHSWIMHAVMPPLNSLSLSMSWGYFMAEIRTFPFSLPLFLSTITWGVGMDLEWADF